MRTLFDDYDMYKYHYDILEKEYISYTGIFHALDSERTINEPFLLRKHKDGTWSLHCWWIDHDTIKQFTSEDGVMDELRKTADQLSEKWGVKMGLVKATSGISTDALEKYAWNDRLVHERGVTTVRTLYQDRDNYRIIVKVIHYEYATNYYEVRISCSCMNDIFDGSVRKFKATLSTGEDCCDFIDWVCYKCSTWSSKQFNLSTLYDKWTDGIESSEDGSVYPCSMARSNVYSAYAGKAESSELFCTRITRNEDNAVVWLRNGFKSLEEAKAYAREWLEFAYVESLK